MPVNLARRLRYLARRQGAKGKHIAAACGVGQAAVSMWLSGGSVPTYENLQRAVEFLGSNLSDFYALKTDDNGVDLDTPDDVADAAAG